MKKVLVACSLILVSTHIVILLIDAGVFLNLPTKNLECIKYNNVHGPEDMSISGDTLFISSTYLPLRYKYETGAIYTLDLKNDDAKPEILIDKTFNLSPHGIYTKEFDGITRLWIINHTATKDSVEVFDYIGGQAVFVKSIKSDYYKHNNDIAAIDKHSFYVTHDHGSKSDFGMMLENYSRIGRGYLTFYDGKKVQKVDTGLSFANGLQIIDNKLFLSEMLAKKITIYDISQPAHPKKTDQIKVPYPVDNISVTNDSEVLLAAHPKMLKLKDHALDPKNTSPSVIQQMDVSNKKIENIYINNGSEVSGASIAIKHTTSNSLFIGNIYENFFQRCKLND